MEKNNFKGWLYLLPAMLFLGVFMVYPLIDVFIYSFEEGYNSASQTYFGVGFYNYAYVLRENNTTRFTDDSEPQGTAGMPTLDVIRKNGCTDVVIVVTRYFGGTLLGTGGLVRAYTQAALGALNKGTPVVYDIYSTLKIAISYSDHGRICQALDEAGFVVDDTAFTSNVEVAGRIKASEAQALIARLTEVTSARAQVEEIEQKFDCL